MSDQILSTLADKPGSIASELGATSVEMNRLFKEGKVIKVGKRQTGSRGRPPVEWALPGYEPESKTSDPTVDVNGVEVVFEYVAAPSLPDASKVKPYASGEEPRILAFIERVFAGEYGPREKEDFNILKKRYSDILRQIRKRVGASNLRAAVEV